MKRMWGVLGAGLIAGAVVTLQLSCNVIRGEAELLVDDPDHPAHSPRWSSDGSKIYFILGRSNSDPKEKGTLWSLDLENSNIQSQITEQEIRKFDISPSGNIAVNKEAYWFWIRDIETWAILDSCQPCEKAMTVYTFVSHPKFSYESEQILYYTYWLVPDSIFVQRMNLMDSIDEEILFSKGENRVLAPGPGDTLIALNDTIYNLESGEQVPLDVIPEELHWNPADPSELLICTGEDRDMFLFDLEEKKTHRINANAPKGYNIFDARFSLGGEKIVFAATLIGDGFAENQLWLFNFSN